MSESPLQSPGAGEDTPPSTDHFVADLACRFRDQVGRTLNFELDGTPTSLAVVDHYLSTARNESRPAILGLLAAGAGAYFGELLRDHFGAFWIGQTSDPRRLRILLAPAFIYFAPIDLAYEAIVAGPLSPEDPRHPTGRALDTGFHLRKKPADNRPDEASDHDWIDEQLTHLPPLPAEQFYSLTGRFETLEVIVDRLVNRRQMQGGAPGLLAVDDYLQTLTEAGPATA